MVAFKSPCGVETGVVRQVKCGSVWRDYTLRDGKIVAEDDLIMRPDDTPWRDPRSSGSKPEVTTAVEQVKAFHDLNPDTDVSQVPHVWADIRQLMAHFALKSRIERERKEAALMDITPTPPPN